jgi:hypothetical protein
MQSLPRTTSANALVAVMVIIGASMLLIGAALTWTSGQKSLTQRYSQYTRSVSAAEAATEKVIVAINQDYRNSGPAVVMKNLDKYRTLVPKASEYPEWRRFRFLDSKGNLDRVEVEFVAATNFASVSSQYRGLVGYPNIFRIVSHAQEVNSPLTVKGAVEQQVQVSIIPLYQFAMFYNLDYECTALPAMMVNGTVHCNGDMYLAPHTSLTFNNDVTCTKKIYRSAKQGNAYPGKGPVVFNGASDGGVSTLTLPIGTNNSIAAVREVIEIPPTTEDHLSAMGQQRFYNRANMIIVVSNTTISITSGRETGFKNKVLLVPDFINITNTFFNGRENKKVRCTDIDIGKFIQWQTNRVLNTITYPAPMLGLLGEIINVPGEEIRVIYIADFRTTNSTVQMGIRLRNAQTLPAAGLTVASPHPVYTLGHYNCPENSHLGTTNTSKTAPASIVADAITILSANWNDNGGAPVDLSLRLPAPTTVNAAFVAGIVQTTKDKGYSGGVENFPRFLENWDKVTSTYNGSMVVMFESKHAVAPWKEIGGYYMPPVRNWSFDMNFRDPLRLPPATPAASVLVRGKWALASAL